MNTNVILADDHQIVLEGLTAVLETNRSINVVATANNGIEVLELLRSNTKTDIVILDINMPEMDGLTCAKEIKTNHPQVKIIILTMYAQTSFVEEIIKIGIEGCLLKNDTGKELKSAIERLNQGKLYYDHIDAFTSKTNEVFSFMLSDRETEVVRLMADGCTNDQIAGKLFISEHTVRTHRKNIMKKTGVSNSNQLIQFAIKNKII